MSPDQMEEKTWEATVYGTTNKVKPVIHIVDKGSVLVPIVGGNDSVFNQSDVDLKMESNSTSQVLNLVYRPHNGLSLRAKIGQIATYELSFDSGSHVNTLSSSHSGLLWGIGLRWNLTQGTIVSSAVNLDLGYNQSSVGLDRFESGGNVSSVNSQVEQREIQAALSVSRRFKKIEPYAGLKIFRIITEFIDRNSKARLKGYSDGYSPMIGCKIEMFDREFLILEGSFADEKSFSGGVSVRF